MNIQNLRILRTEVEEEIELWQDQIALTNNQMQQDQYSNTPSSRTTKRQHRTAQECLRTCQHRLNQIKNDVISYTAKRLALYDLYVIK